MTSSPSQIKVVSVFCASSVRSKQSYIDATKALAHILVDGGVAVKYGGGSTGLMGALADTMIERGGQITGVMPHFM